MNLKRLQAFRAVFEAGSVTRAAEQLHTTQPALSRLIGDLEAELGLALFARQKRRLVPTAEGRMFHREAEKALAAVDQIVDIARDIRTLKGSHLRIVAPMLTAFSVLPAAVAAFRASHPRTRVSLEVTNIRDIADWVANGPFDAVAHAPSIDRRDNRLVEAGERTARDAAKPGVDPVAPHHGADGLPFGCVGLEVGTRGESVAGPRDHSDTHGRIIPEIGPYFAETFVRLDVDGVFHLRPI
jgi:DNA-binding transcriptional LysR family regulator